MTLFQSLILGLVEGLTEFLPVSSTGHLILASDLLGLPETESLKSYQVIIQSATILAVFYYYRLDLKRMIWPGAAVSRADRWKPILLLLCGFFPVILVAPLVAAKMKEKLFNSYSVSIALIVGGVVILLLEYFKPAPTAAPRETLPGKVKNYERLSYKQATLVGFFQCLALWPGTSRSLSTILGGRVVGLNAKSAAEYSFLLAIPTILAATAHDLMKMHFKIDTPDISGAAWIVGLVASFVSGLLVIKLFLHFLEKHSLAILGWYRIAVGALFLWRA